MSDKVMTTSESLTRHLSDYVARAIDKAIRGALAEAALIADQVEAKAEPGHGKETAAEIGRRIRALTVEGRHE